MFPQALLRGEAFAKCPFYDLGKEEISVADSYRAYDEKIAYIHLTNLY